ncbi:MAG: N-acetylmuramidase family protein [Muribaculaceae bacterium]
MRKILSSIAIAAATIAPFARVSGEVIAFTPPDSITIAGSTTSGAEAYTAAVCAAMQEAAADSTDRYTRLTIADYERVATELGIEVATIRAVSDIEAGKTHKGFFEPGMPVINFDRTIFTTRLRRAGKNVARARKQQPVAFAKLNLSRYGSYGKAQHARLESGMAIDSVIAKESTFWGMFQIGGFNWRRCQVQSVDEFARLMSVSEAMQLELFARFMQSTGMVEHLRKKNWRAFARAYNGAGYARKGYHTRLAAAYARYSRK